MRAVAAAAQHRGGSAHHRFQRFRRVVGPVLLPETQQAAQGDHGQDDNDAGEFSFFTALERQPIIGKETDRSQHHQHEDKRVVEGLDQLDQGMRRLVMGDLVGAELLQPLIGVVLGQAVAVALQVRQRLSDAVGGLLRNGVGHRVFITATRSFINLSHNAILLF